MSKIIFLFGFRNRHHRRKSRTAGTTRRTAYDWLKKNQKDILERIDPDDHFETENDLPKKIDLLGEEHKKLLEDKFIDHPSATLDQAI